MDKCKYTFKGIESEKLSDVIIAIEGMVMMENTDGNVTKVYLNEDGSEGNKYDILYFEWLDGRPLWMAEGID